MEYCYIVDFDSHDNSETKVNVLPRTAKGYARTLLLFDRFCELHPQAVSPPNIQTFKAFMEWVGRLMNGRLAARPTVDTMESFRRDFITAWASNRESVIPLCVAKTIRNVRFILSVSK
jgi:hypothetical protein